MPPPIRKVPSTGYQLFMLILSVYTLGVLVAQIAVTLEPDVRTILDYADFLVCAVFLVDFAVSLSRAPDRLRYFFTWGWLDLISSIPVVDIVQWGRLARVLRVLRVLRGIRAARLVTNLVIRRRPENTCYAASLLAIMLIIFCSIAILQVENEPDSNIRGAEDAIWWALTTMATVGYGDRYPVTSEGRLIAAVLMCSGVGLFGAFSGFLAAWLLAPGGKREELELVLLRRELAALRGMLERHLPAAPGTSEPPAPR